MGTPELDGVLVQWGDRLFYPGNRIVKTLPQPRLRPVARVAYIRARIEAAVRRAPQVMVKVTGGGRGIQSTFAVRIAGRQGPSAAAAMLSRILLRLCHARSLLRSTPWIPPRRDDWLDGGA